MVYNSASFFVFLTIFLAVYLLVYRSVRLRQIVILAGSMCFYIAAGGVAAFVFLAATSVIVYDVSRIMDQIYAQYEKEKGNLSAREQEIRLQGCRKKCRAQLYKGLCIIIGVLVLFKAGGMLGWIEAGGKVSGPSMSVVIVPLGISYYTLSSAGYLVDVYKRKAAFEPSFLRLAACMFYFPHIVQGPISHYDDILKQLGSLPKFNGKRVCFGLQRFLWGAVKKLVAADRLALFAGAVLTDPGSFSRLETALGTAACAVWLYLDLSGCIDMLCGVSEAAGITLSESFDHPFRAKSAAEFWRRWNMTMGAWFREYVYVPLMESQRFEKLKERMGEKGGAVCTGLSLAVVWALIGLWHGTGSEFLIWGLYWGVLMFLSQLLGKWFGKLNTWFHLEADSAGFGLFRMLRTYVIFCVSLTLTMTGAGLRGFAAVWKRIFTGGLEIWPAGSFLKHGLGPADWCIVLAVILSAGFISLIQEKYRVREELSKVPLPLRWVIYYGAVMAVLVFGMYGSGCVADVFLYGGF